MDYQPQTKAREERQARNSHIFRQGLHDNSFAMHRLALLPLWIANLFLSRNPAFPAASALNPQHTTLSYGHGQGNKTTKYRERHTSPHHTVPSQLSRAPTCSQIRVYLLAAELQAFSCSYLLFKELAAVKDQAGAHAYVCGEERSGCAGFGMSGPTPGICSCVHGDPGRCAGHTHCCKCSWHIEESRQ